MLKLMKFEFKQNTLSYLGLFLIFLSLAFVVPVVHREMNADLISVLLQTLFIVLAAVIVIGIFVNAGRTYVNSMFKRPGYLTMTLPVNTHQLIFAKVIPNMIWMVLGLVVVVVGVFIFVFTSFDDVTITMLVDTFGDMFKTWGQMLMEYSFECSLYVIGLFGGLTKIMMTLLMCLTLAHTSWIKNHRVAVAVALFIGLQLLSGNLVINGESYSIAGSLMERFVIYDLDSYFQYHSMQLLVSALLQWVQCAIPYVIIWYCLEKKLEIQ